MLLHLDYADITAPAALALRAGLSAAALLAVRSALLLRLLAPLLRLLAALP